MRSLSRTKKLTLSAALIALALVLSLLDSALCSFLPFVPGMKIGLAGGVTLFALYTLEKGWAFMIVAARCLLAGLFSGSPTMLLFSLAGAFLSFAVMAAAQKKLSAIKVSVLGGIAHNTAQILVAVAVTQTPAVSWYFPILILSGTVFGFVMGWLTSVILDRSRKISF
jgi:heptaprenyl diphosphate synthase